MTRLAIIADVHGNLPALQAVAAAIGNRADHWLCAGDIAGHLPLVDEVIDLLLGLKAHCVAGNHDRALLNNTPIASSSAGTRVLQLQRQYVSQKTRDWLAVLPERLDLEIAGLPITMMHGGPTSPLNQKVRVLSDDVRTFAAGRLLVLGNTHTPLAEIEPSYAIVNPGTVGLPTGDRCAQAAIFDTETRTLTPVRAEYDSAPVVARMYELGYDERYFNCLEAGRWIGFKGPAPRAPVIVVGAAIYGEVVAELISQRPDMTLAGFVDDCAKVGPGGAKILGTLDQLSDIAREAGVVDVAVALGEENLRRRVIERVWKSGVRPARLIHPTAVLSPSVEIGPGCIVDAYAYIGPACRLEAGVSIWPGVVLAHHVHVGAYSSLKHRVAIGGNSTVAEGSKVAFGTIWPSESKIGFQGTS